MRSGFSGVLLLALLALLWPWTAAAQSDEPSLGDLARSLRKSKAQQPQARPVIDNDNLAQAMEDVKKLKPNRMVLSVDASGKGFKVSSADVTCSLSFNANAASLLIKPVLVEDVPVSELLKLDGPASIQDDNLQLEVFNATDWELREITVGLTLERKPGESAEMAAGARVIPAAEGLAPVAVEKHSDVTVLYHLKAVAKPFSTAVFRENIGITPGPDRDWRWSIVEARGIRPQPDQLPSEPLPPAMPMALPSPTGPGPVTTLSAPPASAPYGQDKPANSGAVPR
ncbi:MAG: hypothetical protein WCC22_04200 [Terriglobales bacterium]